MEEKARINVLYNVKTKIVYSVGVSFEYNNEAIAKTKMEQLLLLLNNKYLFDEEHSIETIRFLIPSQDYSRAIGSAVLYYQHSYEFDAHIVYLQYVDFANGALNVENK